MPAEPIGASILWHDYESFGANTALDFPAQFACIRTDLELNVIGDTESFYCQPPELYLPHPQACAITGIAPQHAREFGLPEHEFAARIFALMMREQTCVAGYNSMRFDEELTRQLFWRNFFPVYEREYQNGNARFDLIDVLRMCYALRPDGIEWSIVDGKPSFKLENLSAANGLAHTKAHDALSDVEALIALARKLKRAQPRLWAHAFALRYKLNASQQIELSSPEPLVHSSQRFGADRACTALWLPICMHPYNASEVLGIDLAYDISTWLDLPAEELAERIFIASKDLPEGETRVAVKSVHLNRAPMLAPISVLKDVDLQRLQLHATSPSPLALQLERAKALRSNTSFVQRLRNAYGGREPRTVFDASASAERAALYDGFVPDQDKPLQVLARQKLNSESDLAQWQSLAMKFKDLRLSTLLWRHRIRMLGAQSALLGEQAESERTRLVNALHFGDGMTFERFDEALQSQDFSAQPQLLLQLTEWREFVRDVTRSG